MRTPGMGVGSGRFRLLSPRCKSERDHVPPGTQQIEIPVAHVRMFQSAGQIKSKLIGSLSHLRNGTRGRKSWIANRKNLRENVFLPFPWDHVEPDPEHVRMLAVMLLRRCICNQSIAFVPAEFLNRLYRSAFRFAIPLRANRVTEC